MPKKNIHYLVNRKYTFFPRPNWVLLILKFIPMQLVELPMEKKIKNLCKPGTGEGHEGWTYFYVMGLNRRKNFKSFQNKLCSRFRMPFLRLQFVSPPATVLINFLSTDRFTYKHSKSTILPPVFNSPGSLKYLLPTEPELNERTRQNFCLTVDWSSNKYYAQ